MLLLFGSAFCFYALFVFDTVGDAQGFGGAYWVLIVMPLMTVCLVVIFLVRARIYMTMSSHNGHSMESSLQNNKNNYEIELTQRGLANMVKSPDPVEVNTSSQVPVYTADSVVRNDSPTVSVMHQQEQV